MSKLKYVNESEIDEAIREVRTESPDVDWMLTGYVANTADTVQLVGKGTGGADALQSHITDDGVFNGLVRCEDFVDGHRTIKFCLIRFVGDNVKPMLKARVSTHSGAVQEKFKPYHVDIFASALNEVSQEAVVKLVTSTSMSRSNVVDRNARTGSVSQGSSSPSSPTPVHTTSYAASRPTPSPKPAAASSPSSNQSTLVVENEDEIRRAIAALRAGEYNWVLVGYIDKNKIGFIGAGLEGCEEMKPHLQPDSINYGILRTIDKIDNSETVKFAFIQWIGTSANPMQKARVSTHKGGAEALFRPYHVDLAASSLDEISDEIIKTLVSKTSFSFSNVIDRRTQ